MIDKGDKIIDLRCKLYFDIFISTLKLYTAIEIEITSTISLYAIILLTVSVDIEFLLDLNYYVDIFCLV